MKFKVGDLVNWGSYTGSVVFIDPRPEEQEERGIYLCSFEGYDGHNANGSFPELNLKAGNHTWKYAEELTLVVDLDFDAVYNQN